MQKSYSIERFFDNSLIYKPLTTQEIFKKLRQDHYASKSFIGVFARDQIPTYLKYPCSFVVNTDTSKMDGQHWLSFFYDKNGTATFFDSFGQSPCFYGFEDYLNKSAIQWVHNDRPVQNILTSTCGYYSIYFILLMSRGFNVNEILEFFDKDNLLVNDLKIVRI
jgi:hypothetical protein